MGKLLDVSAVLVGKVSRVDTLKILGVATSQQLSPVLIVLLRSSSPGLKCGAVSVRDN